VKLLLDEMYTPVIGAQLRRRGYDVEAVVEREDLLSASDLEILIVAREEGRVVVTENNPDFREQMAIVEVRYGWHAGVILVSPRTFYRGHDRTIGRMVSALEALLQEGPDLRNLERWLRDPS
jgi:hypothetical protein